MSARTSAHGERQGFDSLPAELQQGIIQRVLRSDDVESSAAALLLVSKAWSQTVQPDRCVLELDRRDAHSSKMLASASMLDAEVRGLVFPEEGSDDEDRPDDGEAPDDGQLTTAFSRWKHLRCLQLRQLRDLRCLASLRASSLRACMLEGLDLELDDVAALGAALHAATALEHLAVIECDWCWDGEVHGSSLAGRLLEPLQRCSSLRALELRIPDCLELASLPQLTHFHWADWHEAETSLGTSDLGLGSSLASLILQPYNSVLEVEDAAELVQMLTGNSTVRSLEIDVLRCPALLADAVRSMTGVTRLVTYYCDPFIAHHRSGRLAQSTNAITERLTELGLLSIGWGTVLLPPLLTSLMLDFDDPVCCLQTLANVGHCRTLRRLCLSCVDASVVQDLVQTWVDCVDIESLDDEFPQPSDSLLCDLRCWAAHVDGSALAVQFFCRYVVGPLSELTLLELLIDDFPSEADRAELQAAAACPISWVFESIAFSQIVGVPERFRRLRRRERRAA